MLCSVLCVNPRGKTSEQLGAGNQGESAKERRVIEELKLGKHFSKSEARKKSNSQMNRQEARNRKTFEENQDA